MKKNNTTRIALASLALCAAAAAEAQPFIPSSAFAALLELSRGGGAAKPASDAAETGTTTRETEVASAKPKSAARQPATANMPAAAGGGGSGTGATSLSLKSNLKLGGGGGAAAQSQNPVQEVGLQPQIDLAGSGVATLDIGRARQFGTGGVGSRSQINFSDSALLFGASQRMYKGAIGSFAFGGLTVDEALTGTGNQLFIHQAFVDFQALRYEAYIGRTNTPTSQLVMFPTLRESDMTDFNTVLNPFSNGENIEEHRYANVAAVTFNQGLRQFVNVHAQHLIDSAGVGGANTGLNSFGASYQFLGNPALTSIERFPSYGFGFEHRAVDDAFGGASNVFYLGGVMNLRPSVVNKLDLRLLAQTSFGNDTSTLTSLNDTYRADQQGVALSIRKLYSPFGRPASQWALTAGWKRYSKVSNANAFGIDLSYAKSLGAGFDLVAQLGYERRSSGLAPAFGGRRDGTTFQIGFVYNFASTFNQSVGPRRSITNLLHKYIPN